MKPILVFYIPLLECITYDDEGKSNWDKLNDTFRTFNDEYRVLVFESREIQIPQIEIHSVDKEVTYIKLNELEEKIKAALKLQN